MGYDQPYDDSDAHLVNESFFEKMDRLDAIIDKANTDKVAAAYRQGFEAAVEQMNRQESSSQ